MRPHADPELVKRAEAAEGRLSDALQRMQVSRVARDVWPDGEVTRETVAKVADLVKRAKGEARAYEALARDAVAKLIGPEGS